MCKADYAWGTIIKQLGFASLARWSRVSGVRDGDVDAVIVIG